MDFTAVLCVRSETLKPRTMPPNTTTPLKNATTSRTAICSAAQREVRLTLK
jgi:hypothetical protein